MPIQDIELNDAQAEFIRRRVEAGDYRNASEMVNEALRFFQEYSDAREAERDRLRAELQKGFDDREAGRYIELNSREDIDALGQDISRRGRERFMKASDASPDSSE